MPSKLKQALAASLVREQSKRNLRHPAISVVPDTEDEQHLRLREIIERYVEARGQLHEAQEVIADCNLAAKQLLGKGKHEGFTVYKVGKTTVKRHTRRGFTAVRGTAR